MFMASRYTLNVRRRLAFPITRFIATEVGQHSNYTSNLFGLVSCASANRPFATHLPSPEPSSIVPPESMLVPSKEAYRAHFRATPYLTDSRSTDGSLEEHDSVLRPRNVHAAYLQPLKRKPTHGLPVCDLQIRSYSVRNVEFMADFALRAAYYLKIPASGPIPLPKITQRWTVIRSPFVHKKSQENFERVTVRRLIQIKDANPETVQIWLAFIRKHAYHGVGMKANIWQHEKLGVGSTMDATSKQLESGLKQTWSLFGRGRKADEEEKAVNAMHTDLARTDMDGTVLRSFYKHIK